MQTLSAFLQATQAHCHQITNDPNHTDSIHVVMGNESADLDSVVSAITYAYLLSQNPCPNTLKQTIYLPLVNILKEKVILRKELQYLLKCLELSSVDLLFLDDMPLEKWCTQERLRLTLVDHNALNPKQLQLTASVERIVDHHVDEEKVYPLLESQHKYIVPVGSNASLITKKILKPPHIAILPDLALLLLAPILVDTSYLESVEKTTACDRFAVEKLKEIASCKHLHYFFEQLVAFKNDVSGFKPAMLFEKDFKEYSDANISYGISSLPHHVQWDKENLAEIYEAIVKFTAQKELAYLMLLAPDRQDHHKRNLHVYSPSIEMLIVFHHYMKTDEELKKIFTRVCFSKEHHFSSYAAEKFMARKCLQPLLHFARHPEVQASYEQYKITHEIL